VRQSPRKLLEEEVLERNKNQQFWDIQGGLSAFGEMELSNF
jgi:hypothetical protein